MKTFNDYLAEVHADQYIGTDDCMPDDFNDWLDSQDVNDIIEYAERWGRKLLKEKAGGLTEPSY